MNEPKTVSKKGTVIMGGLTIIAAQTDFRSQIVLGAVLAIYLIGQCLLDLQKG